MFLPKLTLGGGCDVGDTQQTPAGSILDFLAVGKRETCGKTTFGSLYQVRAVFSSEKISLGMCRVWGSGDTLAF